MISQIRLPRGWMRSALFAALTALTMQLASYVNASAQSYYCLPSCSATDGRFLSLCGSSYKSIAGDQIAITLAAPSGSDSITFDVFDGETGGVWDRGSASLRFVLFTDPDGDGVGSERVGSWSGSSMGDTSWYHISLPHDAGAESESGAFFYVLKVRISAGYNGDSIDVESDFEDSLSSVTWSNFKIRSTASISTKQFAFCAPLFSTREANIIYPNYPLLTNPTFDGTWSMFVQVPRALHTFEVWDGDMDYGSFDGLSMDLDDANTSGVNVPRWAGTGSVNEGVAVGTDFVRNMLGQLTGVLGTGSPLDDNLSAAYRRSPSVYYDIIDPNGRTYRNNNPSGNREWERFVIGTSSGSTLDTTTTYLPRGVYEVRITGMDMHNVNAWRYSEGVIGVTSTGTVEQAPLPDCEVSTRQFGRGSFSKSTIEISVDGEAYTWGDNCQGQLGDGSTTDRDEPVHVLKGDYPGTTYLGDGCNGVAEAAIAHKHMIAVMHDGEVFSWGENASALLGVGVTAGDVTAPKRVLKGAYPGTTYLGDVWSNPIEKVAAGDEHSLAVSAAGLVYAWGDNGKKQLGDNTTTDRTAPVRVLKGAYSGTTYLGDNPDNPVVDVVAGEGISFALTANGSVYAWGDNSVGQLGDNTNNDRGTPVRVLKGAYSGTTYMGDNASDPVIAITAMPDGCMALTSAGLVYTWGKNDKGQLGDNTTTDRRTAVRVLKGGYAGTTYLGDSSSNKIVAIASGGEHALALSLLGHVYAWGNNSDGQLGDNTTTDRRTPIRVRKGEYPGATYLGDTSAVITSIGGALFHSLALTGSNDMSYSWGLGSEGRLGEGNTTNRNTPVEVAVGARTVANQEAPPPEGITPANLLDDSGVLSIDNIVVPVNSDIVHVVLDAKEEVELGMHLYDADGNHISRPISHEHVPAGVNKIAVKLPASLPSGLYFMTVTSERAEVTKQFLFTR